MRILIGVAAGITLWLTPVMAVGVHAFGAPFLASVAIGLAIAAAIAWRVARPMAATIAPALRVPVVAIVVALLAAAAIVQIGRISIYMGDPSRTDCSYQASDPWRSRHSCMTAYFEAIRFSADAAANIYQMNLYEPRVIGPLKVDSFHYPPPFLLLPKAVQAIAPDIFQFRAMWFVMQSTILVAVVFGLAGWIGGRPGAYVSAGGVLTLASPQAIYSLQQGNIQSTALPVAAAALVLMCAGRVAAGAPVLAYAAAAKIFPGILIVYLVAARQWRALVATAICGIAIVALTFALFGARPFQDFVRHELPRISSGAAFPQSERPDTMSPNMSVYGLTVRARALGARVLDQRRGLAVASLYGFLVIALAGAAGWRHRSDLSQPFDRLRLAQIAIALLMLGSFRSPFVGFYGLLAAVWLMTVAAATARSTGTLLLSWFGIAAFAIAHAFVPSPSMPSRPAYLVFSGLVFCTALVFGVIVLVRAVRTSSRTAVANEPLEVAPHPARS
jgi:alpha-1,2-mannosyltransferase